MAFHVPKKMRVKHPTLGWGEGNNGLFKVVLPPKLRIFFVIASDGFGWEHVSVSLPDRCPTWNEMCLIKDLFWDKQDCVIQYHPPQSDYVDNHHNCLHLWRPVNVEIPFPEAWMVGVSFD